MKRLPSLFLALLMLCAALPRQAYAAATETFENAVVMTNITKTSPALDFDFHESPRWHVNSTDWDKGKTYYADSPVTVSFAPSVKYAHLERWEYTSGGWWGDPTDLAVGYSSYYDNEGATSLTLTAGVYYLLFSRSSAVPEIPFYVVVGDVQNPGRAETAADAEPKQPDSGNGRTSARYIEVVPPKYDAVGDFSDGLSVVRLGKKEGYIDKTGKEVVPPKYTVAAPFSDGLATVRLDNEEDLIRLGIIDKTGREITPLKYDSIGAWADPPLFSVYITFSEGMAAVGLDGKYGFIDKTGKEVVPLKYDDVYYFSEGLAAVGLDDKYGFIDKTGKEVVPLKYDYAVTFSEGMAGVLLNGEWGFIDKTGKETVPLKYDYVSDFSEGLAGVLLNYSPLYIDKTGAVVVPPKYDYIWPFREGMATVELKGKQGFIDKTGKEVVPLKYDLAFDFIDGFAAVFLNGKRGVVDKTGKEVVPPLRYDYISNLIEDMPSFYIGEDEQYVKWGFFDKTWKEIVPPKYDNANVFHEGLAAVGVKTGERGYKWGFIDKTGQEVIPLIYDGVLSFSGGMARVAVGDWNTRTFEYGLIDKTGKEVVPLKYSEIGSLSDGVAPVQYGGKWGVIAVIPDPLDTAASWAVPHIESALAKGFIPEDLQNHYGHVITRAEFCRMAVKWVEYALDKPIAEVVAERGLPERMGHTFSDVTNTDILAAYRLGITGGSVAPADGKPGQFNPNGQFTRQEAAVMIMNTCKAVGADVSHPPASDFADLDKAASWARPGIHFVGANGIMSGSGGSFNPAGLYTRQESITTLNNIRYNEWTGRNDF